MNTFMTVVGALFLAMSVISLSQTIKRKKILGEVKDYTLGGFKYTDKSQVILILICFILWGITIFPTMGTINAETLYIYIFVGALVFLLLSNLVQITIKPGFYKEGLATGASTLMYAEVQKYEIVENKKDADKVYIYFNGGSRLFSGVRLVVEKEKLPEIKKFLKKRCAFK